MYKQGDILLVPIPFSDLSSTKKRPVLVISNCDYNSRTSDVVVVAITSNIITRDYTILFSAEDLIEGTLKVNSCIRVDKIYSISQDIVLNKFGSVNEDVINKTIAKLIELIRN
ncbi:type II toxin-antitoxin system PemK/MazF family toxin [Desulfitibacter alkalitolerans]|uniref:type II toxin-antitoxin system PemK/MazF family toxin n=1 Tax=Desulfitibacter alkalitolerans TaxID=264641 RepID=UPI000486C738|nr:type II toxin-antitoxin system PemK/MazF family toxin [Desulfitibacter alkalitolerans]